MFACLYCALEKMRTLDSLPEGEPALNAKFLDCLRIAAREIRPKGDYPLIRAECPPLPHGEAEEIARRLKPTPDFIWGYVDRMAPPLLDAREFTIECKRLRNASKSWDYNESYVEDGIQRFLDTSKRYGEGATSGVMVGYWQAMEADEILKKVNGAAQSRGIPAVALSSDGWKVGAVSKLNHELIRAFVVSPFLLTHLWVDLRSTPVR